MNFERFTLVRFYTTPAFVKLCASPRHSRGFTFLIKDGWTITHDPYAIRYQTIKLAADLGAERPVAAERAGQKIVVEIKSFASLSPIQDLKLALGQYILYLGYLEVTDPDRKLYLAVDRLIYHEFLEQDAIELIRRRYQIAMLVVNIDDEEVVKWID